ncbi:MAG: molybdopterin-dependent oxidoreductase [Magnetococcales bacterium]|nr:molybdopterin-dependent oxidoreductase [Magnetococcales bacterium]
MSIFTRLLYAAALTLFDPPQKSQTYPPMNSSDTPSAPSFNQHTTTCPLDCPGACALLVRVEEGRLLEVKGNPDHPFTQGAICGKVTRFREIQEGPRIATPLIRTGAKGSGQFRQAGWEEALDLVVKRLRVIIDQHGSEAIFPYHYGGTMGLVQGRAMERLTHAACFSRMNRNICYAIGWAGWRRGVGLAVGPAPQEMAESDLIILWGINATATHITLMHWVKKARKRGAKLVVVDPYRNRTAHLADLHIAPKPGSDGALAAAMMNVLLAEGLADLDYLQRKTDFNEELKAHLATRTPEWAAPLTGLSEKSIRAFAKLYGQARAPFIRLGLGMSRQKNGAVNTHAVSCLPAITGAWQRKGGGALFATGDAFSIKSEAVNQQSLMEKPTRVLDMSRLGQYLTDPTTAIKSLLVFNANPAGSCPDLTRVHKGLLREDLFTVVHELVMSDTARLADVVLPATSFLEHADLYKSYGQYTLQYAEPVLPPFEQARCNHDVVNALAKGLGLSERSPSFSLTDEETVGQVLADSQLPPADNWHGLSWLDCAPSWEERHFLNGFPQPDRRFHFFPGWPDQSMPPMPDHWPVNRRDLPEAKRYPLDFMTPPALDVLNTTFTSAPEATRRRGPPTLWIHPEDAASRGIGEGDPVAVFNDLARLSLTAHVTTDVSPGLCLAETNFKAEEFPEGISLNALSHSDPVAPDTGPAFHDNRVEVIKIEKAGES